MNTLLENLGYTARILAIIGFIIGVHLMVILVRALGSRFLLVLPRGTFAKGRSLAGLLTSAAIFVLYFAAVGLVLKEIDPEFADWMVAVNYEVEKKTITPVPKN